MPEPRRIALVSSSYDPYFGGVEEHVRQVARQLLAAGHVAEVWTVDRGEHLGMREIDGVIVRYLPTPLPARSLRAIAHFVGAFPAAWSLWVAAIRQLRPHALHVHCFGPNGVYALALHSRFGVPLVVTSHGETLADDHGVFRTSALLRLGLRRAIVRAAVVTAPSAFVLDDLRASYELVGGTVVPNGVDLGIRANPTAARQVSLGRYLLGVGRLGPLKGFDLLIDAFDVAELDHGIRLVIGGEGPQRELLEELIEQRDLQERVELLGRLSPQAVADAMAGALAVVVPSRVEPFGIVALEAWRSGTALVMTNQGGASEFVRDGIDGLLVDPEDTRALAEVLNRIAGSIDLRESLSEAGRRRVAEFTWMGVAQEYERIYQGLPDDAHASYADEGRRAQ